MGCYPGQVLDWMVKTLSSRANKGHQSTTCAPCFPLNLLLSWLMLARLHSRTNSIMTGFERYSKLYYRGKKTLLTPTCLIGINLSASRSVHWKNLLSTKPVLAGRNTSPSCPMAPTTECESLFSSVITWTDCCVDYVLTIRHSIRSTRGA